MPFSRQRRRAVSMTVCYRAPRPDVIASSVITAGQRALVIRMRRAVACAENLVRPGGSRYPAHGEGRDVLVAVHRPACYGVIVGCVAATGLSGRDERVRVTAAAAGE